MNFQDLTNQIDNLIYQSLEQLKNTHTTFSCDNKEYLLRVLKLGHKIIYQFYVKGENDFFPLPDCFKKFNTEDKLLIAKLLGISISDGNTNKFQSLVCDFVSFDGIEYFPKNRENWDTIPCLKDKDIENYFFCDICYI